MTRRKLEAELRKALARLRAVDAEWTDLAYPAGDVRAAIPDNEMPQEWIDARDACRRNVTRYAALAAGETGPVAAMYADTHSEASNPYNVERARMAVALTGRW